MFGLGKVVAFAVGFRFQFVEVSDSLMHKLMATKQRLLAGNAEAARAGAARAEPGAWSAANAEKSTRKKGGEQG